MRTLYVPEEELEQVPQDPDKLAKNKHFTPKFVGTQTQKLDLKALREQMTASQRLYGQARIGQPEGRAVFKVKYPIVVFFIGDVHLDSIYTEHVRFFDEVETIKETPGAYIVWKSNLIANAILAQYPNNMLANSTPPDKQVVAMRKLMEESGHLFPTSPRIARLPHPPKIRRLVQSCSCIAPF